MCFQFWSETLTCQWGQASEIDICLRLSTASASTLHPDHEHPIPQKYGNTLMNNPWLRIPQTTGWRKCWQQFVSFEDVYTRLFELTFNNGCLQNVVKCTCRLKYIFSGLSVSLIALPPLHPLSPTYDNCVVWAVYSWMTLWSSMRHGCSDWIIVLLNLVIEW